MHPILIQISGFKLYTYGLFVALGFMAALWFSKKNGKFYGVSGEDISDIFFIILISAVIGARLLYVLIDYPAFLAHPLEIFKIWNGGLVFFGGFIGAVGATAVALRIKGLPVWKTADIIAPGIALGHSIGRIGCLFAGCCYGKQCELPFAIRFTNPQGLAPLNLPLHPTQVYMMLSNFFLFLILVGLQKHKKFHGMIFLVYIMIYSAFRSVIETFRGDYRGEFLLDFLSMSQGIGLIVSCVALAFIIKLYRSANDPD
ncbi:prolipoprotein diacylglyceryl transferase [Desulfospira joergensenii]|uniref:prolipoprotein diacylglyceryl transferase n=1 Tax=Desulfospira joergensenii TaxID=53329 RepID=UPI0003B5BDB4|nr:prolipoprotein diacylglyceryl transferase [Desulfospira joergensenii]